MNGYWRSDPAKKSYMTINNLIRAVFSTLALTLFALPAFTQAEPAVSATLEYSNVETGLRFAYPVDYVLKEAIAPDGHLVFILIGIKGGPPPRWLLDIGVSDSATYPRAAYGGDRPTVTARQFALEEARNHCTADGDDGGVRCEEAVKVSDFKSARGLAGIEIHLKEISTHYDEDGAETSEESVRGPIYAFDISGGPSIRLLLVQPFLQEIRSADELEKIMALINSFRIEPAQR